MLKSFKNKVAVLLASIAIVTSAFFATTPNANALVAGGNTCWTGSYYKTIVTDYYGGGYDLVTNRNGYSWWKSYYPYPVSYGTWTYNSSTLGNSISTITQYRYDIISGSYYSINTAYYPYYGAC